MDPADLIHLAVLAFLEHGRGAVVTLLDDPEPIYVRASEAAAQLTEWRTEPEILDAVARATAGYAPEHEAVVVREDAISFTVSIERRDESEAVGSVSGRPDAAHEAVSLCRRSSPPPPGGRIAGSVAHGRSLTTWT